MANMATLIILFLVGIILGTLDFFAFKKVMSSFCQEKGFIVWSTSRERTIAYIPLGSSYLIVKNFLMSKVRF